MISRKGISLLIGTFLIGVCSLGGSILRAQVVITSTVSYTHLCDCLDIGKGGLGGRPLFRKRRVTYTEGGTLVPATL